MKGKIRVLILDDDESILKLLSEGLALEGFETETCLDGEEGLQRLNSFRPDYVIVDCLMPRMDGFEFCKRLKSNKSYTHIKIIMMSAVFTDQPFIQETMNNYKPEAFLIKPFDVTDVLKFLKVGIGEHLVVDDDSSSHKISIKEIKKRFKQRGDIKEFPYIKILYSIYMLKSTGVLTISSGSSKWVLYFYQGDLVKTVSNVPEEFFGEVAVRMRCISKEDRDQCLKLARQQDRRVGDVMVSFMGLKPDSVLDILRTQAEMRIDRLVTLDDGTYLFQHAVVNRTPKMYLKLNILEYLLLHLLSGDESFFKQKMDRYLKLNPTINERSLIVPTKYSFTSRQREILELVDGSNSLETILMHFPSHTSYVLSYFYVLIQFMVIHFPVKSSEKESYHYLQLQLEKFRQMDYFAVLGITANSSNSDVKRAYIELAKEYHPDKNINYNQPGIKKIVEEIFDVVNRAYQALDTEEKRREYENVCNREASGVSVDKAFSGETYFTEGLRYFKKNMYREAKSNFDKALELSPDNREYSAYVAWVLLIEKQIKNSKRLKEVKKVLDDILIEDEHHDIANLVYAYMVKYEGNNEQALIYFKKALERNKDLMEAKREIRYLSKQIDKKNILGLRTKKT